MTPSTQHRLRKHPDYQRVYKAGRKPWARQTAYFFSVREPGSEAMRRSETAGPRIGLTVPKALGKAVDRNRIKRRMREIVRHQLGLLEGMAIDVILHPKRSVLDADFQAVEQEVAQIFKGVRSRVRKDAAAKTAAPTLPAGQA